MNQPKKTTEIPRVIYTDEFLEFADKYANRFKSTNGYGRWLAEYRRMDMWGWFTPKKLRQLYIGILNETNLLSYIYRDAVRCICIQAIDATSAFLSICLFDIRVITGEIAVDDDGEELTELSMEEAIDICNAMNEEAEELLFRVYNSNTNKILKI